jgi:hypothetical protein
MHNKWLNTPTPKSIRRLREKSDRQTRTPLASTRRKKTFIIPSDLGLPQKSVTVRYADILSQAAALLSSELAMKSFMSRSVVENGHDGTRLYGEMNRGKWWELTEQLAFMPPGAILLPIICYADGTWLSKNGNHDCKPFVITIGNFPREVMNLDEAKKIICYMPKLFVPKGTRKKEKVKVGVQSSGDSIITLLYAYIYHT